MSDVDPRLRTLFEAMQAEGEQLPPRPEAMEQARAAMHQARQRQAEPRGLALFTERLRLALTPRRLMASGGGVVAGLAVVAAVGWNAPAGTPLHGVRVAHESLAMALPGSDRVSLDLAYAESRMVDAQKQDGSWTSSLDEAGRFLDDARQHLQSGSPLWPRWQDDEQALAELRDHDGGDQPGGAPAGGSGESSESQSSSSQSGGSSSQSGGDDGHESSSASTSTREESQSSSSSSQEEHSSTSSSSSSSNGGDGGGGGESSSSSSSSSTSSSGGGGSDGADH